MNTIVMNTLNGAVTEYTGFGFQSITPTHAGSATGLFALGGNLDVDAAIVSLVKTGKPSQNESHKKFIDKVFLGVKGTGAFRLTVHGETTNYVYTSSPAPDGVARVQPGRGIRETYLAYGFSNPDGQSFRLDYVEALQSTSISRRV